MPDVVRKTITQPVTQHILNAVIASTALWGSAYAQTTRCDFLSWIPKGEFSFNNNVWNPTVAGQQCITVDAKGASFNVTWQFEQGSIEEPVHSFPYVRFNSRYLPGRLWDISELDVTAIWNMFPTNSANTKVEDTNAVANVAIDMFLDANQSNAETALKANYEVMIWFATYNGGDPFGNKTGIQHQIAVSPYETATFQLFDGNKSDRAQRVLTWQVNPPVKHFDVDVLSFLQALQDNNFMSRDLYLGLVELGTETFHSKQNITFTASDFGMNLTSNATANNRPQPSSAAVSLREVNGRLIATILVLAFEAGCTWTIFVIALALLLYL